MSELGRRIEELPMELRSYALMELRNLTHPDSNYVRKLEAGGDPRADLIKCFHNRTRESEISPVFSAAFRRIAWSVDPLWLDVVGLSSKQMFKCPTRVSPNAKSNLHEIVKERGGDEGAILKIDLHPQTYQMEFTYSLDVDVYGIYLSNGVWVAIGKDDAKSLEGVDLIYVRGAARLGTRYFRSYDDTVGFWGGFGFEVAEWVADSESLLGKQNLADDRQEVVKETEPLDCATHAEWQAELAKDASDTVLHAWSEWLDTNGGPGEGVRRLLIEQGKRPLCTSGYLSGYLRWYYASQKPGAQGLPDHVFDLLPSSCKRRYASLMVFWPERDTHADKLYFCLISAAEAWERWAGEG